MGGVPPTGVAHWVRVAGTAVTRYESSPRPAGDGVYSGWLAPDGHVEETAGTAVHESLLVKFGELTREGFFAKGAVRYVDATDHLSLELVGSSPVALENAIGALTDRWANRPDVEVEFIGSPGLVSTSAAEAVQELRRRLGLLLGGQDRGQH